MAYGPVKQGVVVNREASLFITIAILCLLAVIASPAVAAGSDDAGPAIEWQWVSNNSSYADAIYPMGDGGCVIAGDHTYAGVDNYRIYLVRLDADGRMLWEQDYGGDNRCYASDVCLDGDGNIVVFGAYVDQKDQACLLKVRPDGRQVWLKTYYDNTSGTGYCSAYSGTTTGDGGYLLLIKSKLGPIGVNIYKGEWIHLVKTDRDGNVLWARDYGKGDANVSFEGERIRPTADGGYVVAGYIVSGFEVKHPNYVNPSSYSPNDLDFKAFVMKLDADGNQQWLYEASGREPSWSNSVLQVADGGFAVAGVAGSNSYAGGPACLFRLDRDGHLLWSRKVDTALDMRNPQAISPAANGGYLICSSLCVAETDPEGHTVWANRTTGINFDVARTLDGGYVIGGKYVERAQVTKLAPEAENAEAASSGLPVMCLAAALAMLVALVLIGIFLYARRRKR
jgi:hypothetical protein